MACCCSSRGLLIALCSLQLVAVVTRQVFDFLGFMWGTIIGNFLHIIFAIVGLFGAVQYRPKAVLTYTIWNILWLGLNVFVILLYLQPIVKIGVLAQLEAVRILSIGVRSDSWWVASGLSCEPNDDCFLQYHYIEIIMAGVQCLLAFIAIVVSAYVVYTFCEEDDSSQAVNDELEYIKMRYKSPSARAGAYTMDGPPYATLPPPSNYNTLNTTVASNMGTGDREMYGVRPVGPNTIERRRNDKSEGVSVRSKTESHAPSNAREVLPWVHVSPSVTTDYPQTSVRNSIQIVENDEVGPPGYYQVMEQRAERRSGANWRDHDSILI